LTPSSNWDEPSAAVPLHLMFASNRSMLGT
jgi:hypothetical protein